MGAVWRVGGVQCGERLSERSLSVRSKWMVGWVVSGFDCFLLLHGCFVDCV